MRYSSASRFKLSFEGKRLPRSQSLTTLTLTPNSYATRLRGHCCSVRHRFTSAPNCFSKSFMRPRWRKNTRPWGVSPRMRGMGGRRDAVLNQVGTMKKVHKATEYLSDDLRRGVHGSTRAPRARRCELNGAAITGGYTQRAKAEHCGQATRFHVKGSLNFIHNTRSDKQSHSYLYVSNLSIRGNITISW